MQQGLGKCGATLCSGAPETVRHSPRGRGSSSNTRGDLAKKKQRNQIVAQAGIIKDV